MERKKTGLTIIELLIVLGIIAILVGLLVPSLSAVKKMAKETKQKAQFSTIEMALIAFKNDDGDYPPSANNIGDYCGSQKLAEALLGWDLLGFHPNSDFTSNGTNGAGVFVYDNSDTVLFGQRKGPYLEQATTNAFTLGSIFWNGTGSLEANTHVICDVFNTATARLPNGTTMKAGTPVLYYKANPSSKSMNPAGPAEFVNQIYNANDNMALINLGSPPPDSRAHKLGDDDGIFDPTPPFSGYSGTGEYFYNSLYKIRDPKITARAWPYRPDSYILISAGADGLYGTPDDICNFGN
ncbi:MAG: type II secretion system protein [Sedimentisphaerales bacterium]